MKSVAQHAPLHWREPILGHFSPEIARACRVTVVADPDGLLQDDLVATRLRECGFDVVRFDDPIKFRFLYETQHRRRWDEGESSSIVVSAPWTKTDLRRIPHDVLWHAEQAGRILSFSLGEVFEGLTAPVLAELDLADLDRLWEFRSSVRGATLGPNQTRDFVLRTVFELSPDLITRDEKLVAELARLHYAGRMVPAGFAARFTDVANEAGRFTDWPLADLVGSADAFFTFLQERWTRFLADESPQAADTPVQFTLRGPSRIPFAAPEVRSIIDNLFSEGRLKPIKVHAATAFENRWEQIGIEGVSAVGSAESVQQLAQQLASELPEPGVPPTVWTAFALRWAELSRQVDSLDPSEHYASAGSYQKLQAEIDSRLQDWLFERYAALASRSFIPTPTMVHQIPHLMAHRRSDRDRVALVVVDGMSLAQWLTVRDAPGNDWRRGLRLEEHAVFAWIPTITSVSRQAIFAGQAPLYFESTLLSTHAEERHWKAFWEERGRRRDTAAIVKHGADEPEALLIDRTRELTDDQRITALGVVVSSIDRLVHGVSSNSVLSASVKQWGRDGHLTSLLQLLVARGFDIFLTSDHGNVSARGIGRLDVGSVPDERGHRAMLFPDENTRDSAISGVPGAFAWPAAGLPHSTYVALAGEQTAFIKAGTVVRTHGGASIDELLVPFVKVIRA